MDVSDFYPVIHEHDYETFRRFPNLNLPDAYDEWRKLTEKVRRDRALMGQQVRLVEIYPHEFDRFHSSRGIIMDASSIGKFAIEKGSGNIERE